MAKAVEIHQAQMFLPWSVKVWMLHTLMSEDTALTSKVI